MTREEKLKILEEAEHRAYCQIQATPGEEMGDEKFLNLLDAASEIRCTIWELEDPCDPNYPILGFAPREQDHEEPQAVEEDAQVVNHTCDPEPESEPEPDPAPTYTRDQMVSKLTHYIDKCGVNVNSLMQEMGHSKLSEIPADRYQELLDKCEAAAGGNA